MNIRQLNEYLEKFLEHAARYKSPREDFENFFNACQNEYEKVQKSYFEVLNGKVRISANTLRHDKKHNPKIQEFFDVLNNFTDIQNACVSKIYDNYRQNIILLRIRDCYGVGLSCCPKYFYLNTLFKDNKNTIDNWISNAAIDRDRKIFNFIINPNNVQQVKDYVLNILK